MLARTIGGRDSKVRSDSSGVLRGTMFRRSLIEEVGRRCVVRSVGGSLETSGSWEFLLVMGLLGRLCNTPSGHV